jgi:hypothetical protein
MKRHIDWKASGSRKRNSIIGRVLVGTAFLAGGMFLIRAMPDLLRYLRVRRM